LHLEVLFEGQLRFEETTQVGFGPHDSEDDWFSYVQCEGEVSGERLSGRFTWTNYPRRRADGTWLPHGVMIADDGMEILFSLQGCNQVAASRDDTEHRTAVAAVTLAAKDERYRWLNSVVAILEVARSSADPAVWHVRAYECVGDIANLEVLDRT
jgi:hypothetical protein